MSRRFEQEQLTQVIHPRGCPELDEVEDTRPQSIREDAVDLPRRLRLRFRYLDALPNRLGAHLALHGFEKGVA